MANIEWSQFPDGGLLGATDIVVGLRAGLNYKFLANVGMEVVVVITPTFSMSTNTIYIIKESTGAVNLTLPTVSAIGDRISIVGQGLYGWTILQGAGQQIFVSPFSTTSGTGGSLSSTNPYDSINLICVTANTIWTSFGGGQTNGFTYI